MDQSEKRIIFTAEDIARQVQRLASQISVDYQGKEVVLIGVLKGAFIFLADLVRQLSIPAQLDFVRLASYGTTTESSGKIRITTDVELDLEGRDVLIVEDIVDSGLTTVFLREHLLAKKSTFSKNVRSAGQKRTAQRLHPTGLCGLAPGQGICNRLWLRLQ